MRNSVVELQGDIVLAECIHSSIGATIYYLKVLQLVIRFLCSQWINSEIL